MIKFLQYRSKRFGFDGWALKVKGAEQPMAWSTCTTRAEARKLKESEGKWLRPDIEIVKVKISVEVVA